MGAEVRNPEYWMRRYEKKRRRYVRAKAQVDQLQAFRAEALEVLAQVYLAAADDGINLQAVRRRVANLLQRNR